MGEGGAYNLHVTEYLTALSFCCTVTVVLAKPAEELLKIWQAKNYIVCVKINILYAQRFQKLIYQHLFYRLFYEPSEQTRFMKRSVNSGK